ncbi:hypothetical protein BK004_03960 [bacterium CG10_46_32]|nr:MAG: hypothetical protein BK004_03960 [bacterium CG10_46_32]PIR55850.1 MAG: hypothetical protein COU73_03995 [Parcubacteria group bacterium CG10_big_fil_rev_8_21_14_0_10_46_32]
MKFRIFVSIFFLFGAFIAHGPVFAQEQSAAEGSISAPLKAVLQIPLPFVPDNPDFAQYIAGVYRLAIGLAATFAVVMIIMGGYQWIFSGGSSDKTGAAKKRIFGAVIGLILALLSYIILNTITPRLVALRLPYVEPVARSIFSLDQSCQSNKAFAEYEKKNNMEEGRLFAWPTHLSFEEALRQDMVVARENAGCGQNYYIENINHNQPPVQSIGQCQGEACFDAQGNKTTRVACFQGKCTPAYLYGTLAAEQAFSPTPHRRNVKKITVRTLCRTNFPPTADQREISDHASTYAFSVDERGESETEYSPGFLGNILGLATCTFGGLRGYMLEIEVNTGLFGGLTNNHYFIGKDCTNSLADFSGGALDFASFDHVTPNQLFQEEDFEAGIRCDLDTHNFSRY